jgi:hypothetical protein
MRTRALDRRLAKQVPESTFNSPLDIVGERLFTRGEKLATLDRWRQGQLCARPSTSKAVACSSSSTKRRAVSACNRNKSAERASSLPSLRSCCCCARFFAWDTTVNGVPVPCLSAGLPASSRQRWRSLALARHADKGVGHRGDQRPGIRRSQIYSNTICFQTR